MTLSREDAVAISGIVTGTITTMPRNDFESLMDRAADAIRASRNQKIAAANTKIRASALDALEAAAWGGGTRASYEQASRVLSTFADFEAAKADAETDELYREIGWGEQ